MAILDYTEVQALSRTSYHLPLSRTTYHSYHFQEPLKFQNFQAQNLFSRALKNCHTSQGVIRHSGHPAHRDSLTAALDQLRVVASSTSNDPGPWSRQHQQIGQCLLPIAAANFSVDDPAGTSSQQREECRCGLLLTVEVPAKQVCSPVGDRCDQIMNDVCQQ